MLMKYYLGVDIGGTAVKIGVIDSEGRVMKKTEASVSFDGYRTPVLETVVKTAEAFVRETPEYDLQGIGISAAGQVDRVHKLIAGTCGNIRGWNGSRVGEALENALRLPSSMANDANCMCLGEVWTGAASGKSDVIGITIGTGIGGGIVTQGRMLEGKRGLGGELGHFPTHTRDGVRCTCGRTGCFEQYASMTALVRKARAVDPECVDGRIIFEKAEAGEKKIREVLASWIDEIAAGLIGIAHIFNPELILIGGGVSAQETLLIEPLREKVLSGVMPAFAEGLEICAASLGNDAGMVGAVRNFLDRL